MPTAKTRAIAAALMKALEASPLRTRHALAQQVQPGISRSQLYAILSGETIMDTAEFLTICEAIGVPGSAIFREAEVLPEDAEANGSIRTSTA